MRHVELITTGGTIEKTYDEVAQRLTNRGSIVQRMLTRLRLADTRVHIRELMSKDSLDFNEADRQLIIDATKAAMSLSDGVVILHGTDTLSVTGEALWEQIGSSLTVPVVLSGAMRPFEMKRSDALQNLTEALLATELAAPGVYVACHGRVLAFPGVLKDVERGTFVSGNSGDA